MHGGAATELQKAGKCTWQAEKCMVGRSSQGQEPLPAGCVAKACSGQQGRCLWHASSDAATEQLCICTPWRTAWVKHSRARCCCSTHLGDRGMQRCVAWQPPQVEQQLLKLQLAVQVAMLRDAAPPLIPLPLPAATPVAPAGVRRRWPARVGVGGCASEKCIAGK